MERRLKRLGRAYVDGLYGDEDYKREKRILEERAASLVIPGIDVAREAGNLLEDLPELWEEADPVERRKILVTMLDAVYVDMVETRQVVAVSPKPPFRRLLEVVSTKTGSGVHIACGKQKPASDADAGDENGDWLWWRRGRVELPVQKAP